MGALRGLYRARLGHADRLIVKLMRHGGERYALALEVVENHAYDRSRFLRGAAVDEDKIPPSMRRPSTRKRCPS